VNGATCTNLYFQLDITNTNLLVVVGGIGGGFTFQCAWPLHAAPLGNGYFVIGNQEWIALAQLNWQTRTISPFAQVQWGAILYQELHFSVLASQNLLVLVGVQLQGVQQATAVTQVIQWQTTTPYLIVHHPVTLLNSRSPVIYRNHIRSAYLAPNTWHPNGALLFTYVDSFSNLAVIVRGKIENYESYYWVLASVPAVVSTQPYYNPPWIPTPGPNQNPYGPLIHGPTPDGKVLFVYQSNPTAFNSFWWAGGFKLAGIATADGNVGNSVGVTRFGVASGPAAYPLQSGFPYFVNSTGHLHSTLSVTSQFTSNPIPIRLGTAVSSSQLILEFEVIDFINNFA